MIHPEIVVGEELARKVKRVFFAEQEWDGKVAQQVAKRMTQVKRLARKIFPSKEGVELIREIVKLDDQGLIDILEMEEEQKSCSELQRESIGEHLARCMEKI